MLHDVKYFNDLKKTPSDTAITIDGQAYELGGDAGGVSTINGTVTQNSVTFTPTSTIFSMVTGPMNVNLTYLSPIEVSTPTRISVLLLECFSQPTDLLRQSLPFSYMYITAESNDGNAHNVRMYSDISGGELPIYSFSCRRQLTTVLEFLLGAPGNNVSWNANDLGDYVILSEQLVQPASFTEVEDHAMDAVEYYCLKKVRGSASISLISF